jgi:Uma2 family endonuclease
MATDIRSLSALNRLDLHAGDRLTRDEFEWRYHNMPQVKKAELIEGVVYMPSPVSNKNHGTPHAALMAWLGAYWAATPGVEVSDNATVRLDWNNEPQPDAILRLLPANGGQSQDEDKYIAGAPEWIGEVASSSASYDLHDKKESYRRNGVREYLVWRVDDLSVDWFILRGNRYEHLSADENILRSQVFPGLWLDIDAMLARNLQKVLSVLQQGLHSPEHADFIRRITRES